MAIGFKVSRKTGTFLFKWGKLGTADGDMHVPYGIDVDTAGNVWLADRCHYLVERVDSLMEN